MVQEIGFEEIEGLEEILPACGSIGCGGGVWC